MLVMNRFRIWGNKHTNCGQACVSKKLYGCWLLEKILAFSPNCAAGQILTNVHITPDHNGNRL